MQAKSGHNVPDKHKPWNASAVLGRSHMPAGRPLKNGCRLQGDSCLQVCCYRILYFCDPWQVAFFPLKV